MVLTPEQLAQYNTNGTVVPAYGYILKPDIVFQATVAAYIKRAGAFVAIDIETPTIGALTDIQNDMTLYLSTGAGLRNGGSQRVRGIDVGNSRILIGRAAVGRDEGQICGVVGATITVYEDYRPFIKAPYIAIVDEEPIQYKDETLYPGHNLAQPPVAHAGVDRLIITSAATADVELDGTASFAVRQGATITTHLWDIDDGTPVSGTINDDQLTVTFPRGKRWVSLTVTDSNGVTHTTHRLIVVVSPQECTPIEITEMTHNPYGNTLSIQLNSIYLDENVLPRSKILVAEQENYHDTLLGYGERYNGWLLTEDNELQDAKRQFYMVSGEVEDIGAFLQRNNLFPQSLNAEDSEIVGGWFRMRNANIDRMMHYILHWHTNVLSFAGFTWSGQGATYPFPALTTSGGAFWQNIDRLAKAFAHELTVSFRGNLTIAPDPHIAPDADQATEFTLPVQRPTGTVFTFTRSHYQTFSLPAEVPQQYYWLNVLGIVATNDLENVSVVGCVAPSNAPGFGSSDNRRTDFLTISQAELNVWAANQFAAKDGSTRGELTLVAVNPMTIIDPAERQYMAVELPAYLQNRYSLSTRWTVERVEYGYSDFIKTATYYLKEEEVAEEPARTLKQIEDGDLDQSWPSIDTAIIPTTGQVVQGFTGMALTQEELEQTLRKTRLKVYLSQFETDDSGNSDEEGGDGTDPTVPDDPTDPVAVFQADSYRNGAYYTVAKRLDDFLDEFQSFYTDVSANPSVKTLLTQFVNSYLINVPVGAAAAWADYIVDTPDTTLPALTPTTRLDVVEYMWCLDSAGAGLSRYIIKIIDPANWNRWNFMAACISEEQYEIWYEEGLSAPITDFPSYYCYLHAPVTMTLTAALIHAQTELAGQTMNFGITNFGEARLIRIKASGKYENATHIKDAFYVFDKSTEIATLSSALIRLRWGTPYTAGNFVGSAPAYNPAGLYDVSMTHAWPNAVGTQSTPKYTLQDTRSPSGSGTGSITVTYIDLGRYNY